jgi:hypothetical protein
VDTRTISPAGDPFYAAGQDPASAAHACIDGYVFIGRMTLGEDGEEVEVIEAVPCRRCSKDE